MQNNNFNILIADQIASEGIKILQKFGKVTTAFSIQPDELEAEIDKYDALVIRSRTKITADILQSITRLKVIGRAGVGVDNVDLAACEAKGVKVVNSPEGAAIPVAELTLGLMFGMLRQIPRADSTMKSGEWAKKQLKGEDLSGKTLGIIGLGRIGSAVADRAKVLGMWVIGYDRKNDKDHKHARHAELVSLEDVFKRSDVISLHVPYDTESHHMINREVIAQMKSGAYVVCTARGGLIDEDALLEGLNSGKIAGAALDVFEYEPPGLTALVAHERVIVTPHIGAQTSGGQKRAGIDVAEEIVACLQGEPLRWRVV